MVRWPGKIEAGTVSNDWYIDRAYLMLPAAGYTAKFLATFEEFPPRQKAGSFTIGDARNMIYSAMGSK